MLWLQYPQRSWKIFTKDSFLTMRSLAESALNSSRFDFSNSLPTLFSTFGCCTGTCVWIFACAHFSVFYRITTEYYSFWAKFSDYALIFDRLTVTGSECSFISCLVSPSQLALTQKAYCPFALRSTASRGLQ